MDFKVINRDGFNDWDIVNLNGLRYHKIRYNATSKLFSLYDCLNSSRPVLKFNSIVGCMSYVVDTYMVK